MTGYLCNLPEANYKYNDDEILELADMYLNGEWEAYPDTQIKQGIVKGFTLALLLWGFIPAVVVCLVSWIINVPDMNIGGLIIMGVIHGILVILGIVGIVQFFYFLAGGGDNTTADLAEREANAHSQVVRQMGEELKHTLLDNRSLVEENTRLKKEYAKLKKLSDSNYTMVRKLKNKVLDKETTIAKLKSGKINKKNQVEDIDDSLGIEAMFEEVK